MTIQNRKKAAVLAILVLLAVAANGCDQGTARRLALASNAVSIGLDNVQDAVIAGVTANLVSQADAQAVNLELKNVAGAGLALNQAIRDNLSKDTVDAQLDVVLAAFDKLVTAGNLHITNPQTKLIVSTALNSTRIALATISATVRG